MGNHVKLGFPGGDPRGLARVGAMVENPAFYPFLSERDNLTVLARQGNLPKSSVMSSLEFVGLSGNFRFRSQDSTATNHVWIIGVLESGAGGNE